MVIERLITVSRRVVCHQVMVTRTNSITYLCNYEVQYGTQNIM